MSEKEREYVYAHASEYPEVDVCGENPDYALKMLDNIGSCNSEISAVTRYFYDSLIVNAALAEAGEAFRRISIVEMHHLHIFGELARKLGADPRLWSLRKGRYVYWSPGCNRYPGRLNEMLRYAYHSEMETIEKYEAQARQICDEKVRKVLVRVVLDEKCHLKVLDQLYEKFC